MRRKIRGLLALLLTFSIMCSNLVSVIYAEESGEETYVETISETVTEAPAETYAQEEYVQEEPVIDTSEDVMIEEEYSEPAPDTETHTEPSATESVTEGVTEGIVENGTEGTTDPYVESEMESASGQEAGTEEEIIVGDDAEKDSEITSETESETDLQELTFNWEDENVKVTVSGTAGEVIPTEVTGVEVVPILSDDKETAKQYEDVEALVQKEAEKNEQQIAGFLAYDIKLIDVDGNEIEPTGAVSVTMEYKQPVKPEEPAEPMAASEESPENTDSSAEETPNYDISVMHLKEDETGSVAEVIDLSEKHQLEELETTDQQEVEKVSFTTDSFSYYVIIWGKPDAETVLGEEFTKTASDGRFEVTVLYGSDAKIPEDAEFKVTEYTEGTDTFTETLNSYDGGFDWLIDMGFYKDGEEIEPEAPVKVYMSIAQTEQSEAYSLIHFAKEGVEEYPVSELNTTVSDDGVASLSLEMDGFSLVAGRSYMIARIVDYDYVVNHSGMNYVIYSTNGNTCNFLSWRGKYYGESEDYYMNNGVGKTSITRDQNDGKLTYLDNKLYFDKNQVSVNNLKWKWDCAFWNGGINYGGLQAAGTNNWLDFGASYYWGSWHKYIKYSYYNTKLVLNNVSGKISVGNNGTSAGFKYLYIDAGSATTTSNANYGLTFAVIENDNYTYKEDLSGATYPAAVYTGQLETGSTYFYNLADGDLNSVTGLMGVTYTIYDASGNEVKAFTTNSDMKVPVEGLANGTYTMRQTSVPDDYLLLPEEWTFTISDNQRILNMKETSTGDSTGVIFNIKKDGNLEYDKTAERDDYANRTYKVNLTAKSTLKKYLLKKTNITFVLDQSNSMLFPADLVPVKKADGTNAVISTYAEGTYFDGKNTRDRIYANTGDLWGLDRSELYYVIADPTSSSTVYAIWYNGTQWLYQDASYYAKAYWKTLMEDGNAHIQTNDTIHFPQNNWGYTASINSQDDCHGGSFLRSENNKLVNQQLGGNIAAVTTYQVYRAGSSGVYNRLHYLKQSTADLIEAIGSISPGTRVTLETFTSIVKDTKTETLTPEGVNSLLSSIGNITTAGGTRQDIALETAKGFVDLTNYDQNFVVLITDGAPVRSGNETKQVGTFTESSTPNGTIYENLNYQAAQLRDMTNWWDPSKHPTLVTIGLGMANVESGSKALRYISTNGQGDAYSTAEHGEWWYQPKDTSTLTSILVSNFLQKMRTSQNLTTKGTIVDEISDTFYPIDPDSKRPLNNGEWIKIDGKPTTNQREQAGQVIYDASTGWRVEWKDAKIDPRIGGNPQNGWNGTVYLKAKEDFIGGNVIQTNKSATLKVTETNVSGGQTPTEWEFPYPKPDVNVRLLDFDQHSTEVTVFLGDLVSAYIKNLDQTPLPTPDEGGESPEAAIKELYNKIAFAKIVDSDSNAAGNWTVGQSTDYSGEPDKNTGWTTSSNKKIMLSSIPGSIQLPEEYDYQNLISTLIQKADAASDGTASVDGEYQYSSADGYVGTFTYTVKKESKPGEPADFVDHQSQIAGEDVETYTLTVTYVPYPKGYEENGRGDNHHNGQNGPGKEDNASDNAMTLKSENKHFINVIDGSIDLKKYLNVPEKPDKDVEFTFLVKRISPEELYDFEKDANGTEDKSKTKKQATIKIKVPKDNGIVPITVAGGQLTGLPRGVYEVTEIDVPEDYMLDSIENVENETNCKFVVAADKKSISFTIGTDQQGNNALASIENGTARRGVLGSAIITNVEAIHNTDLKLIKQDSIDSSKLLEGAQFKLYKEETCQTVVSVYTDAALSEDKKTDTITTDKNGQLQVYGIPYTSDGKTVYYLKETIAPDGYLKIEGIIKVAIDKDGKMTFTYGKLNAQNQWEEIKTDNTFDVSKRMEAGNDHEVIIKDPPTYDLPSAGGTGIFLYIISGMLLMIAAGLTYIKSRRRGGC